MMSNDPPVFVSPFFDLVEKGSVYDVELLIKDGYDVNDMGERGMTYCCI